jgi:hypothetical protein
MSIGQAYQSVGTGSPQRKLKGTVRRWGWIRAGEGHPLRAYRAEVDAVQSRCLPSTQGSVTLVMALCSLTG